MGEPIVNVEQGKLLGKISSNIQNKPFYCFHGIPYAKPPVGELRFKAPAPPEPWADVRDATKEASSCISRHMVFLTLQGSEDCLYLNVYTPQLPSSSQPLKPVMVWIHGGAFKSGSSSTDIYGPEYLLTEDIVLVTINYRLGILGFLQLEDPSLGVYGNAGLKDQIMALKWVQKNIKNFGGDPSNVTIFGESAGGASVHYLVLSPLAKGLFHKAIAQSGCALNPFATGRSDIVSQVASILEVNGADEKQILQRLKVMTADEVFQLSEKVIEKCEALNNSFGRLVFAPLIENPSPEAFITEEPIKIIKSGNYNHVPLIFGFTKTEGMLIELKIRPRKPGIPSNFEAIIPHTLKIQFGSGQSKSLAKKIQEFYYAEEGSEDKLDNFYNIHTDNYFLRDIVFSAQHHALTSKFPVYLYQMSVDTSLNIFKKIAKISTPGVCHGDDIGYLFKTQISPPLQENSLEQRSVTRFVKYWTNFAKSGNPNSVQISNDPQWKPVLKSETNFIDIGEDVKAAVNPKPESLRFWREIFDEINPLYAL